MECAVAWPNGDPAGNAVVYAYPAGATSVAGPPPNWQCDETGRAQFHVVAPGRYDVGALLGAFQVLEMDVELPRSAPVRLVLPEPCVVTVHMPERRAGPPSHPGASRPYLHLKRDADDAVSYPGRGETTSGWALGEVGLPGSTWKPLAPRGARCRIHHDQRFRVEPETFVAPAELRVVALPRYPVQLHVDLKPPDRKFESDTTIGVVFVLDEGPKWMRHWSANLEAGTAIAARDGQSKLDEEFDRPTGTLRWSGDGVVAGSLEFSSLTESDIAQVVASVEIDPRWEPAAPRPSAAGATARGRLNFRIDPPRTVDGKPAAVRVYDAKGDSTESADDGAGANVDINHPRWAIAWRDRFVSEAITLDDGSSGEISLPLVEGGWLVAVPATMPPDELGEPLIERFDGRPFLFQSYPEMSCPLAPGAVLGPLAPGRVTFRVVLGGRVLAEASADVVAGEHRPLSIPRLRAR